MPFVLDKTHPANGASAFLIEDLPVIFFNEDVSKDSINSGTLVLVNRLNGDSVSADYRVEGKKVTILPALTLAEETGFKLIIVGSNLGQPAGHIKSAAGEDFNITEELLFTTAKREASELVDVPVDKSDKESVYIPGSDPYAPILVDTIKLALIDSNPQIGEIGISPEYLSEKGIRLTFNRPVDEDSARAYIDMTHVPLAGIRAMAASPEDIKCSYKEGGYENFCIDNKNSKLNPDFNIWIDGNDVWLTYPGTPADIEASNMAPPGVSSSSSDYPDFIPTLPSSSSEEQFNYVVYGELVEETHSYNFGSHSNVWLTYESHLIKDRYKVEQGGSVLFDSGCVSTSGVPVTEEIDISPFVPFYVTVIGACDGSAQAVGTAWNFAVSSADPSIVPSPSSSSSLPSSSSSLSSSSSGLSSSSSGPSSSSVLPSSSSSLSSSSSISTSSSSSDCYFGIGVPVLNAEVRIEIDGRLKSQPDSNGVVTELIDDECLYFMTGMFPLYSDIDLIRLELDNLNGRHNDEQIMRLILKNSLKAWVISCCSWDLCNPPPEAIAYAEYKTQIDIYDMTFTGSSIDRGVSRHLGDFSVRTASRASNARRTPKEEETAAVASSLLKELRYMCTSRRAVMWAIKGSRNPTTKPNYRTRTYNWLPTSESWTQPAISGYSRYVQLPKFGDLYS